MAGLRQLKITKQITSRESLSLNKYLSEISSIGTISPEEEKELAILIQQGDQRALDKLVKANLRFVISVAKQHQNMGESLDELVAAGNIGLIEAAKRFDHTRGFKFISYAVWWIRQSIMGHVSENGRMVRIPLNKVNSINKLRNSISSLEQKYERSPDIEEIVEEMNKQYPSGKWDEEVIIDLMMLNSHSSPSMDAHFSDNSDKENGTLHDVIPGESYDLIEREQKTSDLKIVIEKNLNKLSLKEKKIIVDFYGLDGGSEKSLGEIGEEMELTRERVRQIKEKALKRLRFSNRSTTLNEYM